jgi:hypothetical protein
MPAAWGRVMRTGVNVSYGPQVVAAKFRIAEIAVPTRYFPEASSASFVASTGYGLRILALCLQYALHARGFARTSRFDSLRRRYTRLAPARSPRLT